MCNVVNDWAACSVITTATPHRSSGAQAGRNGWSGGEVCSGSPIADPVPRRLVSANSENASRIRAFRSVLVFGHDEKTPLHILIDSSGLAVHAGQLRRAPNSRDYRKLHLCVDEQSGEVIAGELTSKRARDSSRVASLVGQIDSPISSARADTAYDASGVYEAIENHSAHRSPRVLIPPRKGAQLASGPASSRQRNRNIAAQARLGKRKWHTESGYSKRSKVETPFHRYKAIVGSAMRARGLAAQRVEARIGCKILNTMTALGMPDSEMIG